MYRDLGLQVTPAHTPAHMPPGGQWKRPVLDWTEFQNALVPDSLFARWYDPANGEHRNRKNMGVITGEASGRVFVVDLDVGAGKDGLSWWLGLIAVEANGLEPETPSQRTGGGGRQLLFRAPVGWTPPTFKAPDVGSDIRGDGGFAMMPPSMHASGRIYDWEPGRAPWQIEILEAPLWLCEAIDKLRLEHGGQPTGPHERAAPTGEVKNAFGRDVDDREHKLQALAWAVVVDLYRQSPIPPTSAIVEAELERAWAQYEVTTKSRLEPRPGLVNADLLELEGRGRTELRKKVAYALDRWDGKVAEAAKVPKPEEPAGAQVSGEIGHLGATSDSRSVPASSLSGEPPVRRWLVENWIARGEVNSLYGGGATGKSLLALLLAHTMALGAPWVGLGTIRGSSLLVSCEDDLAELHRRHADIRKGLGHGIGNPFGDVRLWDRTGHNNLLALPGPTGPLIEGPFMVPLLAELDATSPALLILDTLADVYGGSEIDRVQVNGFLKTCLGGLIARRRELGHDLTILLLGHPSVAGMVEGGRGFSGSTAWENGVRSRLYLSRPDNAGPDERVLSRAKANYAGGDDGELPLLWADGLFVAFDKEADLRVQAMAQTVANEVASAWRAGSAYVEKKGHPRFLHTAIRAALTMPNQPTALVVQGLRRAIDDGLIYASKNTAKRGWRTPVE